MRTAYFLGALSALCAACGWFDDGRECSPEGSLSCDGDEVRICVAREDEPHGANGPKTKWQLLNTCEDDPVFGAFTCGVANGMPQCIPERAEDDAGASSREQDVERTWLRVDVVRTEGGYEIHSVGEHILRGAPLAAASGAVAAVSFSGGKALDAALVPLNDSLPAASSWVVGNGADEIALVDASGTKLVARSLDVAGKSASLVGGHTQALSAELPPTLRVIEPGPGVMVAEEWRTTLVHHVVRATPEMLKLVGAALAELPIEAASALTEIGFASSEREDGAEEDAGVADGGVEASDAGVGESSAGVGKLPSSSTALVGTQLWVDASPERLDDYRSDNRVRRELEVELIRRAGEAYVWVASVLTTSASVGRDQAPKLPDDFPAEIRDRLLARISPMLGPGESFSSAWSGLHRIGSSLGIAGSYRMDSTNEEAVADGFASAAGAAGPASDFGEYLARATIVDAWDFGPCGEIPDSNIDELRPRLFVPLTKLYLLWGLRVITYERLEACIGDLQLGEDTPAITLHKASGERVVFSSVLGSRSPYVHGEVHVSAVAQRGEVSAVADLMYRSLMPGVIRFKRVVNPKQEAFGATFALTHDREYITSPAVGGVLVVTRVTRERLELRGLMVQLAEPPSDPLEPREPLFGASAFPLVTVRLDNPLWQEEL